VLRLTRTRGLRKADAVTVQDGPTGRVHAQEDRLAKRLLADGSSARLLPPEPPSPRGMPSFGMSGLLEATRLSEPVTDCVIDWVPPVRA
jgi:hypothetical protein